MPVPKKRTSKSKRNMRRSHDGLKMLHVRSCQKCNAPVLPHHMCQECGTYRGKEIMTVVTQSN